MSGAHPPSTSSADLIARWVRQHPHKPGLSNAVIVPSGVPVWALVNQLLLDDWNRAAVAGLYELPFEAVQAAVAYYDQHRQELDEQISHKRAAFA